jgi:chromosome segregation ATPase
MQTQGPYRTLPSPSSINCPVSASVLPAAYSPSMNQSVHNAHLQDLQHQISTKTLALQTLQREHDQLLGAFSRSQIRCSTLDKKSQVSDHEINSLTEEKIRLQAQVETLETQVEELLNAKDEVQKQTTADAAQWRQIVAMSSQLQAQGAEEAKRYKADRESWERDRDGLQRRITELESGKLTLIDPSRSAGSAVSIPSGDILASTSLDILRAEIVRLRSKCADMEVALQDLRRVTEQMDRVMGEFANIRERITVQTRHGLQGYGQLEGQGEGPPDHNVPSTFAD